MAILNDKDIIAEAIVAYGEVEKVTHRLGSKIMSFGLEPHGYTLTLSSEVNRQLYSEVSPLNKRVEHTNGDGRHYIYLDPKECVTLKCNELLTMPNDVVGFLYPKSSYSRHGLMFSLAVVDAGFNGHISFSVFNASDAWHKLYIDEGILQIVFHRSNNAPMSVYNGQYQENK